MGENKELKHVVKKIIRKINKYGFVDEKTLDEKLCKYALHIVVLSIPGITIYDNYFDIPIPNYNDNPAAQCAIKTQKAGEYKITYGCNDDSYYAMFNKTNIVMVSTDKRTDPKNIAWDRLANMDIGVINGNARLVADQFAIDGVYVIQEFRIQGRENIYNFFVDYFNSKKDASIKPVNHSFYFDPIVSGGALERLWSAIDTLTNQRYEQDDAIIYRIDPNGFFSYHHGYFDPLQKVSLYQAPPVINQKCGCKCDCDCGCNC